MSIDQRTWAEGLILQLPSTHDGRNSWLMNHGVSEEADNQRQQWELRNGRPHPKVRDDAPSKDVGDAAQALEEMRQRKDDAYTERNNLVAYLASIFPAGTARTDIPGWDPEWHGCVYIDTPAGQMSWHYHDSQAHLFDFLDPYKGEWDGHTTEEKYERLRMLRYVGGSRRNPPNVN